MKRNLNKKLRSGTWVSHLLMSCVIACLVLLNLGTAFANEDYRLGLNAFIEENYELAQSHWIQAAKEDHSRAMFNLGLLHQQGHLPNSDPLKAKRWFSLAGQAGYAAADYHHAQWLVQELGNREEALPLLRRAADNGYKPAIISLASLDGDYVPIVSSAAPAQSRAEIPLQLKYRSHAWLTSRGANSWTIQLLAFTEETKVKEFIDLHRLHDRAAYFVEKNEDQVLYKLVYGEFKTKQEADEARGGLKAALSEHGPWLRTMASVQSVIN